MSWLKAKKEIMPKSYVATSPKMGELTSAEVPCFNCGKLVHVMLPFYGCVFCSDCTKSGSYSTADFHPHVTLE